MVKDEQDKINAQEQIDKYGTDLKSCDYEIVIDTPENRQRIEEENRELQISDMFKQDYVPDNLKQPELILSSDYPLLYPVSNRPFYIHYDSFKHGKNKTRKN